MKIIIDTDSESDIENGIMLLNKIKSKWQYDNATTSSSVHPENSIDVLELNGRTRNSLMQARIYKIGQLEDLTSSQARNLPGIGKESLSKLYAAMRYHNISFTDE